MWVETEITGLSYDFDHIIEGWSEMSEASWERRDRKKRARRKMGVSGRTLFTIEEIMRNGA